MTLTKQKNHRLSPNQRKRLGQHHNQGSHHYTKPYWPYLPVLAVLIIGLVLNTKFSQQHHSVLGYSTDISPQVLLAETNGDRVGDHESALELNAQLSAAAQAKANDMAKRNYWSHVTPDGRQPWSFIVTAGYQYEAAGENLAYGFGTSDQVMTAWMQSPEHRANILDADYKDVGFGTANSSDYQGVGPETIIVAMYAEPIGMVSPSTDTFTSKPVPLDTQAQQVSRIELVSASQGVQLAIAVLAGAAITLFFIRHALAWRRVLLRGERFVINHPILDALLMAIVVIALTLARTTGTIL